MDLADSRTERYIPLQDISFAGTASGMQPDKDYCFAAFDFSKYKLVLSTARKLAVYAQFRVAHLQDTYTRCDVTAKCLFLKYSN
jgi:hypothetical protein